MSTPATSFQHSFGSPSHSNQEKKWKESKLEKNEHCHCLQMTWYHTLKILKMELPLWFGWIKTRRCFSEDVASILASFSGWGPSAAASCGIGGRGRSDPVWLWHRPVAAALVPPLAWELLHAAGVATKSKTKKRKSWRCYQRTTRSHQWMWWSCRIQKLYTAIFVLLNNSNERLERNVRYHCIQKNKTPRNKPTLCSEKPKTTPTDGKEHCVLGLEELVSSERRHWRSRCGTMGSLA